MFQRCLICTDFSDGLHRMVEFAPSLAAGGITQAIFLHCVPLWEEGEIPRVDEEGIQAARARFQAALPENLDGIEVRAEVLSGNPVDNVKKVARNQNVDVILTGMSTKNLLQEKLFGSTTAELARSCLAPILILRPQLLSAYTREELDLRCQHLFRYLLVPYNGSNASDYLIEKLKTHVRQEPNEPPKHFLLMSVIEEGGLREISKEQKLQEAQQKLEQLKTEFEQLGVNIETEVRLGEPFAEILNAALVYDISAIALSSNRLGRLIDWPVRSFAGELMRRSWHPVLFFPPPECEK